MHDSSAPSNPAEEPPWLTNLVKAEPRAPLVAPYMVYLLLLAPKDLLPSSLYGVGVVVHVGVVLWVVWLFRRHLPCLGRLHLATAMAAGLLAAWVWVVGQECLDGIEIAGYALGNRLPFFPGEAAPVNPHDEFGTPAAFWTHVVLKIGRATTAVPIVEELFWRGFILQAFVSWSRYDEVPLGKFTWISFLGSSLLSTFQHPDNWGVSIACWMLFNALFYWKKSLLCLMVTHAVTNLALYIYVVQSGNWRFW